MHTRHFRGGCWNTGGADTPIATRLRQAVSRRIAVCSAEVSRSVDTGVRRTVQESGEMRPQPSAIGFLRHDVSGAQQQWDEAQIQHLARRLGYDLCKTLIFGPETDRPFVRVRTLVSRLEADAVIVPSLAHFGGHIPEDIVQVADIITVSPENTYARSEIRPE
ncbi:hypothetical protein ACWEP5_25780 [Nocardia niigatensis]